MDSLKPGALRPWMANLENLAKYHRQFSQEEDTSCPATQIGNAKVGEFFATMTKMNGIVELKDDPATDVLDEKEVSTI